MPQRHRRNNPQHMTIPATSANAQCLHLRLAQQPGVVHADGRVQSVASRDAALLAWLALEGPTPRAQLAALLWPESPAESARNTLRQRLFQLRKQLGVDVVIGQHTLALADGVAHDLHQGHLLLADVSVDVTGEFAAWLVRQREQRLSAHLHTLSALADGHEQAGRYETALPVAQAVLQLAPLSEAAHRRVMRLHYLLGDRAAALLAFDACEQTLKDEVGTRPSAETLGLLAMIEQTSLPVRDRSTDSPPPALLRPPVLVGRERELEQIFQALDVGRSVLLQGEPGIGKSRLLEAIAEQTATAWLVRARPGDDAVPMALVTRVLRLCEARSPQWLAAPDTTALRYLLTPGDDGRPVRSQPLLPALRRLLERWQCESAGAILLIDDWQFADQASVEVLGEALGTVPAVVSCRTQAGEPAERRMHNLALAGWQVVRPAALSIEHVQALLSLQPPGPGRAPEAQAATLWRRVGGNPLFVLEALRHTRQTGRGWSVDDGAPPGVRALVADRLQRLTPAARQLLQLAALASDDFDVELAEAVSGRSALELAEAWAELQTQGLFDRQGTAHDVHAEVARTQIPEAIAQVLHRRIAEVLSHRSTEPARLAYHWSAAGDIERAVPAWEAAGHRAWHQARAVEAFTFLEAAARAQAARRRDAASFDLWFQLADAMSELGDADRVELGLVQMRLLARQEHQTLRVRFTEAVLRWIRGDIAGGLGEMSALLADAIALADTRVEAECHMAIASRATADGRFDDALQHLAAGERLMRDEADERRAEAFAACKAMVLSHRGRGVHAQVEIGRLLPRLASTGNHATWMVLSGHETLQHMLIGQIDEGWTKAQAVWAAVTERDTGPNDLALVMNLLCSAARWSGHWAAALTWSETLMQRLDACGVFHSARITRAAVLLDLGRVDLAWPLVSHLSVPSGQRERRRHELLQLQLALTAERGHDAATLEPQPQDVLLAAQWMLWSGLQPQPVLACDELDRLLHRCEQGGLDELVASLRALRAWRFGGDAGAPPRAAQAVLWWACYAGWAAERDGDLERARRASSLGLAAIQGCLTDVAPAFAQSCRQRNPLHLRLQGLAARLTAAR